MMGADQVGTPASAIQSTYDVGNSFWALWLDARLVYSCALWESGDSLEDAQIRKIDYLIEESRAPGARRVLDVGCGWGGMLERLVREHHVQHAVGLTLSQEQFRWNRDRAIPGVEVRLEGWQAHTSERPYEAIVSAGAFEHFARNTQRRAAKIAGYREFFQWCHDSLKPGGRLALQTCAKTSKKMNREAVDNARFIWKYIFPESEVPRLSEVAEAADGTFDVIRLQDDRWHYARTAEAWLERLTQNESRAAAVVGSDVIEIYKRYLQAVVSQFDNDFLALLRITLVRV